MGAQGLEREWPHGQTQNDRELQGGNNCNQKNPFSFQDVITCADSFTSINFFAAKEKKGKQEFFNILLGTDKKFALFMKEECQGINYFTSIAEIPVKIKFLLKNPSGNSGCGICDLFQRILVSALDYAKNT